MKNFENLPESQAINFDTENGLKILAQKLYYFLCLGFMDEVSPHISELLRKGTLAKYEPRLKGCEIGYGAGEEEYEKYEFTICFEFVFLSPSNWATLFFLFKSNDKCQMFIEFSSAQEYEEIIPKVEEMFNRLNVEPLSEENSSRDISWQRAEEIISNFLLLTNYQPRTKV